MEKKTLTVFTPTYNRARTLFRTYTSLCRQTSRDFEWLVIDDGSMDNTRSLVSEWIEEGNIPIRYIYQENQGMHGAHNTAYANMDTLLCTCIDSDDYMPDDAVEKIISFWNNNGADKYAGFMGLDIKENGQVCGTTFPEGLKETTLREYYEKLGGRGDKKLVYRTAVVKKYPKYPLFEGEHYVGLGYLYHLIDQDYPLLVLNEPLVVVEYLDSGSSRNMWRQYWNNPKGFAFYKILDIKQCRSWKLKVKNNIQYVAHSIRAHNKHFLAESPTKFLTLVCLVPGCLLFLYNGYMVKRNKKYKA